MFALFSKNLVKGNPGGDSGLADRRAIISVVNGAAVWCHRQVKAFMSITFLFENEFEMFSNCTERHSYR